MFIKIFSLLVVVPVIEIYTLLELGGMIGFWPTVALIVLTGIAGSLLLRFQGLDILARIQQELAAGRMPTEQLLDGAMILAGGIVLLTPGFWTDLCGFFLLVPATRELLKTTLRRWLKKQIEEGHIRMKRL